MLGRFLLLACIFLFCTIGVFYKLVNYILYKGCLLDFVLLCHDSG